MFLRASILLTAAWLTACSNAPAPADASSDASGSWPCTNEWIPTSRGGCAPALMPGSWRGSSITVLPDGGFALPSATPGSAMGPPAVDWTPQAGVPTCPARWQRDDRGGCTPVLREDCPASSAPLPSGGCTSTGEIDCPSGEWPDLESRAGGARVVYARAGADNSVADGSRVRPFGDVTSATVAAGSGGWIALAAGRYATAIDATAPVHLEGVCAARVVVDAGPAAQVVRVRTAGVRVWLGHVSLVGTGAGVLAENGGHVTLERVVVRGTSGRSVRATGAASRIDATDTFVDGVSADATTRARGLQADLGATLSCERCVVSDAHDVGAIGYSTGTTLSLRDVLVRRTLSRPDGTTGIGIGAGEGGLVNVDQAVVESSQGRGIGSADPGTRIVIHDTRVTDTRPWRDDSVGFAVIAGSGSTIDATRLSVVGNTGVGLAATGAVLVARDSVVADCAVATPMREGFGIYGDASATLTITNTVVSHARGLGVRVSSGATATLSQLVVRETDPIVESMPQPMLPRVQPQGGGVVVLDGARVELRASAIDAARDFGAGAVGARSVLQISDSVVRATRSRVNGGWGRGLHVEVGARLSATRVTLWRNTEVGAFALGGQLELANVYVGQTAPRYDGLNGNGVAVSQAGRVVARSLHLDGNREAALAARLEGSTVEVHDVLVTGTATRGRNAPTSRNAMGRAVVVSEGASLSGDHLALVDNHEVGLYLYPDGTTVTLDDLLVRGVSPTSRGFGVGILVEGRSRLTARRVSVTDVAGAAVAARQDGEMMSAPGAGGTVRITDLFVQRVQSSPVQFAGDVDPHPAGRSIALGVVSGTGCTVELERAAIFDGGFGLYVSSGILRFVTGVISGQLDAAAAMTPTTPRLQLDERDVLRRSNANDGTVTDSTLPDLAALPRPTPVCDLPTCP